tara:strand:+ start:9901 stop:10632 length:732 start_codon:yes stop_codon:yes gene_type:complete
MKTIQFSSKYYSKEWRSEYGEIPKPTPSLNNIPEYYKKLERYTGGNKVWGNKTVKTCIPFLDAYKTGYMIPFSTDINCWYDKEKLVMNFEIHENMIKDEFQFGVNFHGDIQVPEELRYNRRTVDRIFKFNNTWQIKTPPGYSCFFTQPNNTNLPFQIIDGVVDTDVYPFIVNFPFYWTSDSNKPPLMLQQGSPMVQVIPFKREEWKSDFKYFDQEATKKHAFTFFSRFENAYKNFSWKKKTYR